MYMTTTAVIKELGVSRNWIVEHMRGIGKRTIDLNKGRRTVYITYDRQDILDWINENAVITRQTAVIPHSYYGMITDEEAKKVTEKIEKISDATAQFEAFAAYFESIVPEAVWAAEGGTERNRIDPWVPVTGVRIENFKQLQSMRQIMEAHDFRSTEMAYRYIYKTGMARVSVHGRVWYIEMPAPPKGVRCMRVSAFML